MNKKFHPLEMWVVYEKPQDYPNSFVARKFTEEGGKPKPLDDIMVSASLDTIRAFLAANNFFPIPRHETDEPQILEVWW